MLLQSRAVQPALRAASMTLEDDLSNTFVGLRLKVHDSGIMLVQPSPPAVESYAGSALACPLMHNMSWAPTCWKRSLVIGLVARIDRLTTPASHKAAALAEILVPVLSHSMFTPNLTYKWSLQWRGHARPWIEDAWRTLG